MTRKKSWFDKNKSFVFVGIIIIALGIIAVNYKFAILSDLAPGDCFTEFNPSQFPSGTILKVVQLNPQHSDEYIVEITSTGQQSSYGLTNRVNEIQCPVPSVCGNGICEYDESVQSCSVDCSTPPQEYCGDGICQASETIASCSDDCGNPNAHENASALLWFIGIGGIVIIVFLYMMWRRKK